MEWEWVFKKGWNSWFAWHPVVVDQIDNRIENGYCCKKIVWLETVMRKKELVENQLGGLDWVWFYKPMEGLNGA